MTLTRNPREVSLLLNSVLKQKGTINCTYSQNSKLIIFLCSSPLQSFTFGLNSDDVDLLLEFASINYEELYEYLMELATVRTKINMQISVYSLMLQGVNPLDIH